MRVLLWLILSAVLSGAAHGSSIIYENPWNAAASDAGAFSHVGPGLGLFYSELAGEFLLGTAASVNRATWYGTMWRQPDPLNTGDTWSFDVRFFADSAGLPGQTLATQAVLAAVTDAGVNLEGERAYQFDASFPSLTLAAETSYWFSVVNTGPPATFRWNSATSGFGSAVVRGEGGDWQVFEEVNVIRTPLNFTLLIPEPSGVFLAISMVICLLLGAARKLMVRSTRQRFSYGERDISRSF